MSRAPSVVFIDTAYTLNEILEKQHQSFFLARNASGLFQRVWSVHPVADTAGSKKYKIDVSILRHDHTVIEGKVELYRLPRALMPLNLLLSLFKLYGFLVELVRREQVSLVIGIDPFLSGILGLAVARRTGRPFVLRISGNHDEIYEAVGALAMPRLLPTYRLQRLIQRFVLKRADLVTAINANNLEYGVRNGAKGKTAILPISANISPVHRRPPEDRDVDRDTLPGLCVTTSGPFLLYLGRLIELKHPDDALRAMALCIQRYPTVTGLFVGSGPMQPQLKRMADDLGVSKSIHFLGQMDQLALSRLIPRCIMLSPSAGQLAFLEGALGGAPIVAYDRDFQPEFIEDGVNGFIVPFRNYELLAERAFLIIDDPVLAQRFSVAIREKALHHTDPERVKRLERDALRQVLRHRTDAR